MKNVKNSFLGLMGLLFPLSIYVGANYTSHFTSNLMINVLAGAVCGAVGVCSYILSDMYFSAKKADGESDDIRNATTLLLKYPYLIRYVNDERIKRYRSTTFVSAFINLVDVIRQHPEFLTNVKILQYLKDTKSYYFNELLMLDTHLVPFTKTDGQIVLEFSWIVK